MLFIDKHFDVIKDYSLVDKGYNFVDMTSKNIKERDMEEHHLFHLVSVFLNPSLFCSHQAWKLCQAS